MPARDNDHGRGELTLTGRIARAAGITFLALSGCQRGDDAQEALYQINAQTGVFTSKQGLEINFANARSSCLTAEEAQRGPSTFGRERSREFLTCMNAASVRQINPQLPMTVDSVTQMVRVSSDGPSVTYHYKTTVPASAVSQRTRQQLENHTRRLACAHWPMRQAMEVGGSFTYRYADTQGNLVHQFTISAC